MNSLMATSPSSPSDSNDDEGFAGFTRLRRIKRSARRAEKAAIRLRVQNETMKVNGGWEGGGAGGESIGKNQPNK